jgi:tetratricopeptide (TPR) repeat protein
VRYQLQQYDRAIEAYQRVVGLDDRSSRGSYKLALAQFRNGDVDASIAAIRQTLRLDHRMAEAHYLLGLCMREQHRRTEAVKAFEQAIAIAPALIPAREELADLYGELDRRSDQLDQLQVLAGLDRPKVERQVAVGLAHARSHRWDAAVVTLSGALERTQDDPTLYRAIGQVWLESAQARDDRVDLSKAREALARIAASPTATSDVLTLFARAALQEGDYDGAEQSLLQATQRFPIAPSALLLYAGVAERQNHPDVARRALIQYEALITADGDFAAHAARSAALSLRVNDAAAATEWVHRGLQAEPEDAALLALAEKISGSSDRSRPADRPRGN